MLLTMRVLDGLLGIPVLEIVKISEYINTEFTSECCVGMP